MRKRYVLLVLVPLLSILALFAVASRLEADPQAMGGLQVLVVDATSGAPLPGASVTVVRGEARVEPVPQVAGVDGVATFAVLAPGEGYRIRVVLAGYVPYDSGPSVRVGAGAPGVHRVALVPEPLSHATVLPKCEPAPAALASQAAPSEFSADFVQDLPVPGRFYQKTFTLAAGMADGDGRPDVHRYREHDFKAQVSGIANMDLAELEAANTAKYKPIVENGFLRVEGNPPLTFGAERDTASYANVRRMLRNGELPPLDAVDVTEMVNYFPYVYPAPSGSEPFSTSIEVAACPWEPAHRLVRLGFRTRDVGRREGPGSSLTLLVDVSGSMSMGSGYPGLSKIALVQQALRMLASQLTGRDTVSIVVYAGREGVALPPTRGSDTLAITRAIDDLAAGGGTNGEAGLRKAYEMARAHFVEGGVNQVILLTDGDFNIGRTGEEDLVRMAKEYADRGIFLNLLGVGTSNLNGSLLEGLTRANGTHHYIDSPVEAQKILVEELGGTLDVVARDVKFLVEFNPRQVAAYRLIGYEHRVMSEEEYYDDTKTEKAGEIGSGHTVTALVEIVPASAGAASAAVPPRTARRYQKPVDTPEAALAEIGQWKVRYKLPTGGASAERAYVIEADAVPFAAASEDFRFATAVAAFGMLLRESDHLKRPDGTRRVDYPVVLEWARATARRDPGGYRGELLGLIQRAEELGAKQVALGR